MKRIALIAIAVSSFFSCANVMADESLAHAVNPQYKDGAVPGKLGYDVDHNGLVDKINTVDVLTSNSWEEGKQAWDSASRAHDRLDHAEDRIDAHKKSIGNLYKTKVDVETFEKDQARQDKQAQNNYQIANNANQYAAEANENAGIAMGMASDASKEAQHATNETKRLDAVKADRADVDELNKRVNSADSNAKSYAQSAEQNANMYTDRKIKQVKRESRAGTAGVAAMANIPTARELNRLSIGAGTGFYKDTSAVALGASYRFNERTTFKGSVSTTGRDTVAGAGVSYDL